MYSIYLHIIIMQSMLRYRDYIQGETKTTNEIKYRIIEFGLQLYIPSSTSGGASISTHTSAVDASTPKYCVYM